jgi:hypothetical protein
MYYHKRIYVSMSNTRYSCQIVVKQEFSRQNFEKYSNIKFHENLFSGSRVYPCGRTDGRTDRHDEANSPFLITRLKTRKCTVWAEPRAVEC